MRDLKEMMDSVPLNECQTEIANRIGCIKGHGNEMKAAILLSILLRESLNALKETDPKKFLEQLKSELEDCIKTAGKWETDSAMLNDHMQRNRELLAAFSSSTHDIERIDNDIRQLLDSYDKALAGCATKRCKQNIAEIEAELQNTPNTQP